MISKRGTNIYLSIDRIFIFIDIHRLVCWLGARPTRVFGETPWPGKPIHGFTLLYMAERVELACHAI